MCSYQHDHTQATVPVYSDFKIAIILYAFVLNSKTLNSVFLSIWSYAAFKSIIHKYRGRLVSLMDSLVMKIAEGLLLNDSSENQTGFPLKVFHKLHLGALE